MKVIYEDNHIIIVNKQAGEIVQGDKTGDRTLADDVKAYIKEKYAKPGDVFLGVVHRLDRPVSGVVVFARTSKALSRLNDMFRTGKIQKTYQPSFQPRRKVRQHPMASGSPLTPGSHATSARTRRFHIRGKWPAASEPYSTIASSVAATATTSWRCASTQAATTRYVASFLLWACPSRETSNTVRRAAIPMAASCSTHATLPSSIP